MRPCTPAVLIRNKHKLTSQPAAFVLTRFSSVSTNLPLLTAPPPRSPLPSALAGRDRARIAILKESLQPSHQFQEPRGGKWGGAGRYEGMWGGGQAQGNSKKLPAICPHYSHTARWGGGEDEWKIVVKVVVRRLDRLGWLHKSKSLHCIFDLFKLFKVIQMCLSHCYQTVWFWIGSWKWHNCLDIKAL